MSGEAVLVTGGSGYVGGWCVVRLLQQGYTVRASVRNLAKESAARAAIAREAPDQARLSFCALELGSDEGWDKAVEGCDYVLHVASPLGVNNPKDPDELIVPAREGAKRAVGAALRAGVTRVVITSSVAANHRDTDARETVSDETVWSNPDSPRLSAYMKSKTIAERAAWDLASSMGAPGKLVSVNPTLIAGPVLSNDFSDSVKVIQRLLTGSVPGVPRLGWNFVDVRDLADLHILAMTHPDAGGERFIGGGTFGWMGDVADLLRARLGDAAGKVTRRRVPDFVIRLAALFDSELAYVAPGLGQRHDYSPAKALARLGWKSRPFEDTVLDCARSLIAIGAG